MMRTALLCEMQEKSGHVKLNLLYGDILVHQDLLRSLVRKIHSKLLLPTVISGRSIDNILFFYS